MPGTWPRRSVHGTGLGLLAIALVGYLDYITSPEMVFSIFYVIPVGLVAWLFGRGPGVLAAGWATAAWLLVEHWQLEYAATWLRYWNAAARLAVFLLAAVLASALVAAREKLRVALDQRTSDLQREIREHRKTGKALAEVEERYRESQRLEAVGRLAAGIAHDFRNDLALIEGYSELMADEGGQDGAQRERLEEIRHASRRAARLTSQLLSFGRREVLRPTVVPVNALLDRLQDPLGRVLGPDIRLVLSLSPDAGLVRVDVDRFEQALLNLVSNARDAMPGGGRVRIETAAETLAPTDAERQPGLNPGPHAVVRISDTGSGIPETVRPHVFEPYFTTKAPGHGTGLGLAVVHGFMTQTGGGIVIEGGPGRGTTFRLYFPRPTAEEIAASHASPGGPAATSTSVPGGNESVLVVEDNWQLRELTAALLARHGYRVSSADPGTAEAVAASMATVDLLLTDVAMPGISGPELGDRLRAASPGTRVLYMSGFALDVFQGAHRLDPDVPLITKPFAGEELARAVRRALDAPPPGGR